VIWMPCSPGIQSRGEDMGSKGVKRETLRDQSYIDLAEYSGGGTCRTTWGARQP
jgi:hypothetical protein